MRPGVTRFVARAAHLSRLKTGDQRVLWADGPRPLNRQSCELGRHALDARQGLTVSVCRYGREGLIEDLRASVSSEGEASKSLCLEVATYAQLAYVRAISLHRRAVRPRLAKERAAHEETPHIINRSFKRQIKR